MSNIAGILMNRMNEARQRLVHVLEECDAIHASSAFPASEDCACNGCKLRPMIERTIRELKID